MADTDVETFAFDANETITAATGVLTRLDTNDDESDLITNTDVAGEIAELTVEGLTRGVTYELAVTFENAAARAWTRTLILDCVA